MRFRSIWYYFWTRMWASPREEVAVSDTGIGMADEVMENLWKPLQTTKAKGVGLGLPIVKRIVEAHGGTVNVETKFGKGSTLTIILPIKQTTKTLIN